MTFKIQIKFWKPNKFYWKFASAEKLIAKKMFEMLYKQMKIS